MFEIIPESNRFELLGFIEPSNTLHYRFNPLSQLSYFYILKYGSESTGFEPVEVIAYRNKNQAYRFNRSANFLHGKEMN